MINGFERFLILKKLVIQGNNENVCYNPKDVCQQCQNKENRNTNGDGLGYSYQRDG
jgi:hypothetical protein